MTTPEDLRCPMFGDLCRHCSHEKARSGNFTKIEFNLTTKRYDPKGLGHNIIDLGAYCNNIGAYVQDLHYCPARRALHRGIVPLKKEVKERRVSPRLSPTTKGQQNKRPQKIKTLPSVKPKKKSLSDSQQKLFKGMR